MKNQPGEIGRKFFSHPIVNSIAWVAAAALALIYLYPLIRDGKTLDPSKLWKFWSAEKAIRETLVDPGSAKFDHLWVTRKGVVCGLVNSKNQLGGYVGNTPFYYDSVEGNGVVRDEKPYLPDPGDQLRRGYPQLADFDDRVNFLTAAERSRLSDMFEAGRADEARDLAESLYRKFRERPDPELAAKGCLP